MPAPQQRLQSTSKPVKFWQCSWPSYNPNDKNGLLNKDAMRNRGAVDSFEPGSTMKPLTVAMALEREIYSQFGDQYESR